MSANILTKQALTTHEAKVGCALVKKQHQQQRQKKDHVYEVNPLLDYPVRKKVPRFFFLSFHYPLFHSPLFTLKISHSTIFYLRCKRANGRHLRNQFPAIPVTHPRCIVTFQHHTPMYQWHQQQKQPLVAMYPFQGKLVFIVMI